MNENITSIVVNGRSIEVRNGCVLVICGHGPDAGAFWKKIEDCSDADFDAAKVVTAEDFTPKPWGDSLDDDADDVDDKDDATADYKNSFEAAVNLLAYMRGDSFLKLVRYARENGNSFRNCGQHEELLSAVVNADDCYCTAIIKLTRHLGDAVERRAFVLFEKAEHGDAEDFLDFFTALQTVNSLL